jgi:subfamily B ATP-binding cassette protein MsbA
VLLPLAVAPIAVLGRRVRKRSKQSQAKLGDSVEVLTQAFTGMRTVKSFRAEERELARYHGANRGYLRASMKMVRAVATINASSHVTSFLGFTVVLVVAGWFAIRQPLFANIGQMAIFLAAVGSVYQSVKRFTNTSNKVQESGRNLPRPQRQSRQYRRPQGTGRQQ